MALKRQQYEFVGDEERQSSGVIAIRYEVQQKNAGSRQDCGACFTAWVLVCKYVAVLITVRPLRMRPSGMLEGH